MTKRILVGLLALTFLAAASPCSGQDRGRNDNPGLRAQAEKFKAMLAGYREGKLTDKEALQLLNSLASIYSSLGDEETAQRYRREADEIQARHPQPGPTGKRRERLLAEVRDVESKLAEWRSGKRGHRDAYVVMDRLLTLHMLLREREKARDYIRQRRELVALHPDLASNPPNELSEEPEQRRQAEERERQRQERVARELAAFEPKDSRVYTEARWEGRSAKAYQYRIEFFKVNGGTETRVKTLTFGAKIRTVKSRNGRYLAVATSECASYSVVDDAEGRWHIERIGQRKFFPRLPRAAHAQFHGVVDIDGRVEWEWNEPDRFETWPRAISDDGKIVVGIVESSTRCVRSADGLTAESGYYEDDDWALKNDIIAILQESKPRREFTSNRVAINPENVDVSTDSLTLALTTVVPAGELVDGHYRNTELLLKLYDIPGGRLLWEDRISGFVMTPSGSHIAYCTRNDERLVMRAREGTVLWNSEACPAYLYRIDGEKGRQLSYFQEESNSICVKNLRTKQWRCLNVQTGALR